MDREKYRRLFIDEARENVATLQGRLVAFEDAQRAGAGAPTTRPMMDEVFRAAHSLKGMAAAMAFADFTKLSHALEDLADGGRQGRQLDQEAIDLLLDASSRLFDLVERVDAGEEPVIEDDLTERIWRKVAALHPGSVGSSHVSPVQTAPAAASRPGTPAQWVVHADFSDTGARGAIAAYMVLEQWLAHDDVASSVPDRDALKTPGTFNGRISLVLQLGASAERVKALLQKHDAVNDVDVSAPQDASTETLGPTPVAVEPLAEDETMERRIRVQLEKGPLMSARAFLVHRAVAKDSGFVGMVPTAEQVRRGELAGDTVQVTLRLTEREVKKWCKRLAAEPGVQRAEWVGEGRTPQTTERKGDERTVRVRTGLLDGFIDSVGELLLTKSRLNRLAGQYASGELSDLADEIERVTRELHDRVMSVRMMPLSTVTDRFGPVVRQLARKLEKTVAFAIEGAEIELDRAILDEIGTPLLHMVRNAVDHAHEGDAARTELGKQKSMKLTLKASRDRDFVEVELHDNGGGIDPEAVVKKAVARGLIRASDAVLLSDSDKVDLVCTAGFSMRDEVSETSGRGVGMDVVKTALEKLGGSLRIESIHGQGTRFVMRLPLTVAIIQVLVVQTEGVPKPDVYAIPIHRVERALSLADGALRQAHGQRHVSVGGELVPLFDLGQELGFGPTPDDASAPGTAVLIKDDAGLLAFRVGAVVGQEEVVVKPLGAPLSTVEYLAGAALLADGRCAYILEPGRINLA